MPREDWRYEEQGRVERDPRLREDYGQADYSDRYGYDPTRRAGYRTADGDEDARPERAGFSADPRSWRAPRDDPQGLGSPDREPTRTRRGPSDRVLWAVVMENLERSRHLDLREVDLRVEDAEVTLNGWVRRKEDKRRIEDLADIEGVRHVQNNLRVHEPRRWMFF